jgi:hypothetical protein
VSGGAPNLVLEIGRVETVRCKEQLLQCPTERGELVRVFHARILSQPCGLDRQGGSVPAFV